ncbi:MAG: hypothetical protein CXZ00_15220 [Acidobacteria bacterium]|nr:MAG: hypothetical protein CXZ00_15220 [Acidobacteriota bacterium]
MEYLYTIAHISCCPKAGIKTISLLPKLAQRAGAGRAGQSHDERAIPGSLLRTYSAQQARITLDEPGE